MKKNKTDIELSRHYVGAIRRAILDYSDKQLILIDKINVGFALKYLLSRHCNYRHSVGE